jgi:hypothetical protein
MEQDKIHATRSALAGSTPTRRESPARGKTAQSFGEAVAQSSVAVSDSTAASAIREELLRDPRYPIHRIADRFLPYLRVLVEQFHPQRVILFGSYAYGQPDRDSDIDLLIIKDVESSALQEKINIRKAWRKMPRREPLLPFDLILVSPQRHQERLARAAGFYDEIVRKGLVLV